MLEMSHPHVLFEKKENNEIMLIFREVNLGLTSKF